MNRRRPNNVRFRWSSQPNTSSLPSPQSAEIIGSLFSSKSRKPVTFRPEERLPSEAQVVLDIATQLIECVTGGHGRCTESACACRCHK
jgi:hypothetical protein